MGETIKRVFKEGDQVTMVAIGLFISFMILIGMGALSIYLSQGEEYNERVFCNQCKIVSRHGTVKMYNIDNTKNKCPHCDRDGEISLKGKTEYGYRHANADWLDSLPTPFAPRFTLKERKEIDRSLKEHAYYKELDIQVKSHLELQQKKLKEMKGEL